ncbi:MAG: heavy-metal-associated domain-containing protein, partial [Ignavibacteria bacterium]|nr:heavy-metal-associated domain-containing protein [Ignavibacteria bacterium]
MKTKIITLFSVIFLLASVINSNAYYTRDIKTTTINISDNMICHMSVRIMEKAFKKAKGVETVEVNRNEKTITITY